MVIKFLIHHISFLKVFIAKKFSAGFFMLKSAKQKFFLERLGLFIQHRQKVLKIGQKSSKKVPKKTMDENPQQNIFFEEFELDRTHRRLLRNGEPVAIYAKAFDLLTFLAKNTDRILTKDEILEAVWEGQIVEEANLSVQISALRKALGETASEPRFLTTIPGTGYKFNADVRFDQKEIDRPEFSNPITEKTRVPYKPHRLSSKKEERRADENLKALRRPQKKISPFIFAGIFAISLTVVLTAVYLTDFGKTFRQSPQARTQSIIKPSQQRLISTFPGSHTQPNFSPDGKHVAFINITDDIPQIWVKELGAGEPVQITFDKERAERPRWSPIDNKIAYTCRSEGSPDICLVSIKGGQSMRIINGGRNANWSWDGRHLVFERGYEIWTAGKDGEDQKKVRGVPQADLLLTDRMPAFSPDGSQIAFFQNEKGPMGDYWIIPAAGGKAKRLTFDLNFGGTAAWMPEGNDIVFPSQRGGSLTLWRVSVNGGHPEPVLSGAGEDAAPDISRDGNQLIYTNTRKSFILTVTDAKTGESRELRESRLEINNPSFSPDGSRIAFFGFNNSGDLHIFTTGADGENLVQITKGTDEKNIMPQWSADGRTIYYYQFHPTSSFRKIPATGGKSDEIVADWEWDTHNDADVSPDETEIIYTRLEKGEPAAAFIRNITTGRETEFTLPIRYPRWSHDGKFITGTLMPGGKQRITEIVICSAEGKQCHKVTNGYYPRWSHDDSYLYYYSPTDFDGESVWKVSTKGGDDKKIADLQPMSPTNMFFNVSPQGQIVWFKLQQNKSELWLANFKSGDGQAE